LEPLNHVLAGPRPGYVLLYERLAGQITDGTWPPDHLIPSERELCDQYGVSRTTVRQALQLAERRGFVIRVPGRGTFVAQPHIQAQLSVMIAFRDALNRQGITPGVQVLVTRWARPPARIREVLRLGLDESTLFVRWTPLAQGQPLGVFDSYVGPGVAAAVERHLDSNVASAAPTYELAAASLGVDTLLVDQSFEADTAAVEAARTLSIERRSPVFRVTSVFRTVDGTPVEYNTAIFAAARYSLHMVRQLKLGGPGDSSNSLPRDDGAM